jgi:putative transposase
MADYRRAWCPGGTYFFTVNLLRRQGNDLLIRHIGLLRSVVSSVQQRHPFRIHGWVVLPEHLHCVIELPPNDADFATRWRLIKMGFSKGLPRTENLSAISIRRGERGIWQRRYWEHLIRDERDYQAIQDNSNVKVSTPYVTIEKQVKDLAVTQKQLQDTVTTLTEMILATEDGVGKFADGKQQRDELIRNLQKKLKSQIPEEELKDFNRNLEAVNKSH